MVTHIPTSALLLLPFLEALGDDGEHEDLDSESCHGKFLLLNPYLWKPGEIAKKELGPDLRSRTEIPFRIA